MTLKETLLSDIKSAMKSGEAAVLSVLRMLSSTIKNREIDKKGPLTDEEVLGVITSEVKKRKESASQYRAATRPDLATTEEAEVVILMRYLPKQLSGEEVEEEVKKIIARVGSTEFPVVMREAAKELKGKADGAIVSFAVKKALGQ